MLQDHNCTIRTVAADRHPSVTKIMKDKYPNISHVFDLWHIVKGVKKKLLASKNDELTPWVRSIANQLWYCAANSQGNSLKLREMWTSILHHVCNQHEWVCGDFVTSCSHDPYTPEEEQTRPWLKKESEAFHILQRVVLDKRLLQQLQQVSANVHTGSLESLHALYTKYVPKRKKFSTAGMKARLQVAALDNNFNNKRQQATTKQGNIRFKQEYSKPAGGYVVKPIKGAKDWSFRRELLIGITNRCARGKAAFESHFFCLCICLQFMGLNNSSSKSSYLLI